MRLSEFAFELAVKVINPLFFCWSGTLKLDPQGYGEEQSVVRITAHDHPVEVRGVVQKPKNNEFYISAIQEDEATVDGFYPKNSARLKLELNEFDHEHLPRDNGSVFCLRK